jgi:hypothetical protein
MQTSKSVTNNTPHPVTVTFYVSGRMRDSIEEFGTRSFRLLPGQTKEIGYGDSRHSFLAGVKLECEKDGVHIEHTQMVIDEASAFDCALNASSLISIRDIKPPILEVF